MKIRITILLIWFFAITTFGQKSDTLKINTIDYQVSLIPEKPTKNDNYEIIQSSGLISKKTLIFFKKPIGSFHEDVIYKNDTIALIKILRNLENISIIENFYYNDDELIRYDKREKKYDQNDLVSEKINSAYFHSSKLSTAPDNTEIDENEILKKSNEKKSKWNEFIKQTGK